MCSDYSFLTMWMFVVFGLRFKITITVIQHFCKECWYFTVIFLILLYTDIVRVNEMHVWSKVLVTLDNVTHFCETNIYFHTRLKRPRCLQKHDILSSLARSFAVYLQLVDLLLIHFFLLYWHSCYTMYKMCRLVSIRR